MLGLDPAEMDVSDLPKNTQAEAFEYVRKFGKQKKLVIVTDATHMPRAMRIFKDSGLDAVPAPTNFYIRHGTKENRWSWIPSGEYINLMEIAMHEYAGMFWYKLSHR
jgi:uncharacterized SAM-binding protein YcdF (DUF218 family)